MENTLDEFLNKTGILDVFKDICDETYNQLTLKIKLKKKNWIVKRIYFDSFLSEPCSSGIVTKHSIDLFIKLPGKVHNSEIKTMFNQLEDIEKDTVFTILYSILNYTEGKTNLFLRDFIKYLHDSSTCVYNDNITHKNITHKSTDWVISNHPSFCNPIFNTTNISSTSPLEEIVPKTHLVLKENGMEYINLTPHPIVLNNGEVFESKGVARISTSFSEFDENNVCTVVYGDVEGIPEPKPETLYIVSGMVLSAPHGRDDLVAPATGHPAAVRNDKGHIISVPGFVR